MVSRALVWNEDYSIGIPSLDYEHRNLFSTISRLHQTLEEHKGQSVIEECLGEIHARMSAHFALEEKIMQERKYPHYAEHKREHDALLDVITDAMLRYENDPLSEHARSLMEELTNWIVNHVLTTDKKMRLMAD